MGGRNRRTYPQRPNRGDTGRRESMLDMGRMTQFVYYAEQIITETGVKDNTWNTVLASIIAKASRMSIDAAQDFIREKVGTGQLPKEAEAPLCQLLERYARLR
jgi:hypothetical protein